MSDPLMQPGGDDFFASNREPDRNDRLIPMINIVFLLLTFFLIAGTFHAAEPLDIEPPEAPSEGELQDEGPVVLVDRNGTMALGEERLGIDAIIARLKRAGRDEGDEPPLVRIKADRATRVKVVLPLLKRMTDEGLSRVQLVAVRRN